MRDNNLTYQQAVNIRVALEGLGLRHRRIWAQIGNASNPDSYKFDEPRSDDIHQGGFKLDEKYDFYFEDNDSTPAQPAGALISEILRDFSSAEPTAQDFLKWASQIGLADSGPGIWGTVLNWAPVREAIAKQMKYARTQMGI